MVEDGKVEITLTVKGIKKEDGVITEFNVDIVSKITNNETVEKGELIDFIRGMESQGCEVSLVTATGTKIVVVDEADSEPYLRTQGDESTSNDLLDLPEIDG